MSKEKYNEADHLTGDQKVSQQAFYTPETISLKVAKLVKDYKPGDTILEPCVGKGNLLQAMKDTYGIEDNSVFYGIDIDPEAIQFCIEKFPGGHFQVGNILEDDFTHESFWAKDPFEKWKKPKPLGRFFRK